MRMIRYFRKNWRRRQKTRRVKYSFSVPNLAYLDLCELDEESALDGIDIFAIESTALKGQRAIVALSKDFLKKYKGTHKLTLLESEINPWIGMSLQEAMEAIEAEQSDIEDAPRGYYRYIFFNLSSLSTVVNDIDVIRSKKLSHYKVQVAEL